MQGIAQKLVSSLSGFWWALDERERRTVMLFGLWLCAVAVLELDGRERRRREEALRAMVREEVHGRTG